MRLPKAVQLIVAVALVAGLTISATAFAAADRQSGDGSQKGTGKKCSGKKGSGTNGASKSGAGTKKCKGKRYSDKAHANDGVPECNSVRTECHIDVWLRQGSPFSGAVCSSFDSAEGFCVGSSTGNSQWSQAGFFPKQGLQSSFTWKGPGGPREVDYTVDADFTILEAFIRGNVPSGSSPFFYVTDAWNRASGIHWKTLAKEGAAPSQRGGPLWIDYSHQTTGSYVHLHGYLVPK